MKSRSKKIVSVILCAALLAGSAEAAVCAMHADGKEVPQEKAGRSAVPVTEETAALVKEETVYVFTGTDGGVQKLVVSDWLKNQSGSASLSDRSELTGIENVKGDEGCTVNGDNTHVWDAKGKDIYYSGSIQKDVPVELRISYELDGKSISPEALAGKSGRVKIRFDYENKQYQTVELDGKQEKIYVPFVMLTGMLLDNEIFTNVEVVNGRLVNDGDRTAVVGIALPGMQENLALDAERFEIPDYIEICADVKSFELANTFTIGTNEMFGRIAPGETGELDALAGPLNELTAAVGQLEEGSLQLYNGLCTLLDKSGELVNGINQLADGASALKAGAESLKAGGAELADGAKTVADGLGQLTANNDTLNAGSKQVFESLLHAADAQLAAGGLTVPELTVENYAEVLDGVAASLQHAIAEQEKAAAGDVAQAAAALEQTKYAAASISALKGQLDAYHTFYTGLLQYTAGVASAKEGADALSAGASRIEVGTAELYAGTNTLCDGSLALKEGASALTTGVTALRDGAKQLSDGVKEFNEEGIQKLITAVDGKFESLFARINATADAAQEYQSFSGISEEAEGSVKFIYRTEAIQVEKQ